MGAKLQIFIFFLFAGVYNTTAQKESILLVSSGVNVASADSINWKKITSPLRFWRHNPVYFSPYFEYNYHQQNLRIGLSQEFNASQNGGICKCRDCPCSNPVLKDRLIGYALAANYNTQTNSWMGFGRVYINHWRAWNFSPTFSATTNKEYAAGLGILFKARRMKRSRRNSFRSAFTSRIRGGVFVEYDFSNNHAFMISTNLYFGNNISL